MLELQNASRTRLFLILGLISLGIIALLLYFIYRNKENLNKVLNAQNKQLDELNHELAIANDTKAKLFGIIGHDMRAPVSQIVQLLQLQKENPHLLTGEAKTKHEEKLKTASENVLETMEDLLLWSKSQMQSFKPRFVPVNITDIIQKELSLTQQRLEDRNIRVQNEMPEHFMQKTDENFVDSDRSESASKCHQIQRRKQHHLRRNEQSKNIHNQPGIADQCRNFKRVVGQQPGGQ